jgi:hypothetical protein
MTSTGHTVVKPSPVSGRGLFAKKSLAAGEPILIIERPLLCVLDELHLVDTCGNCFKQFGKEDSNEDETKKATLAACSRCKQIKFCGKVITCISVNFLAPLTPS